MASKKKRPHLTQDLIVATAATLVDREGDQALSARRLAFELGVEAMSLYHHVSSMQELLNLVTDRAMAQIPLPTPNSGPPRKLLKRMLLTYLRLSEQRPHTFRVISSRRWRNPGEFVYQSHMVGLLCDAGLTPRAALRAARLLVIYIHGAGQVLSGWLSDSEPPPVADPGSAMAKAMKFSNLNTLRADLESGLDLLLDGLLPEGE